MEQESGKPFWAVLVGMAAIAFFTALLVIPFPFAGDQSLYVVFARMMNEGSLLYSDVWDVKQPGIFWFYLVSGAVAGFTEIAVHGAEATLWIGGSILVALALRRFVDTGWVAALFLVFGPAAYFAAATTDDLAQVEPTISLLIAGIVVLVASALEREDTAPLLMIAAGLLSGIVGVFKLLALVIPLAIVLTAGAVALRRGKKPRSTLLRSILWFGLGTAIPLLALAGWVYFNDLTAEVWFTWVEYPPQMLEIQERPLSRLIGSTYSFAIAFGSVGILALFRVFNRRERGRALSVISLAALIASALYILLQLWWNVHFFVLAAPLGILAVQGVDDLLSTKRRTRILWFAVAIILSGTLIMSTADRALAFVGLITGESLEEYQAGIDLRSETAQQDASPLDVAAGTPVYVLGMPLIMYLLEADQSIPINGWSPEFWTPELWERVITDLEDSESEYVFFSDWVRDVADERAPWFSDRLEGSFSPVHETPSGVWLTATTP